MQTSGRSAKPLEAIRLVEQAVRMCGVLPSTLGSEQLSNALIELRILLNSLSNRGLNLWCLVERVLPVSAGAGSVSLLPDVVEVKDVLWRSGVYAVPTSSTSTTDTLDALAPLNVSSVAARAPSYAVADYTLTLEASDDTVTWTPAGSALLPRVAAGDRIGLSSSLSLSKRYWRLTHALSVPDDELPLPPTALGAVPALLSVSFLSGSRDTVMSPMNRDSYAALPNKQFTALQTPNYFLDKQRDQIVLRLWPNPSSDGPQIIVWCQRHIQDALSLTERLDIPSRWQSAVLSGLAAALSLTLPKDTVSNERIQLLMQKAEADTQLAERGETDGSSTSLVPRIAAYTR